MIVKNLKIKNFKSVRDLSLPCERINVFIGEPNTGKSNILEALGLLSYAGYGRNLKGFVRHETLINFFYNENLQNTIEINASPHNFKLSFNEKEQFIGEYFTEIARMSAPIFIYNYEGFGSSTTNKLLRIFKFYRFKPLSTFPIMSGTFLHPPFGENLLHVIRVNEELRNTIRNIFEAQGLKLALKPYEKKIEVQRETTDGIIITHPYSLVSETLQRIVFYLAAIETNKDSVIAFEEPEAHAFPYYTKMLAETIALDSKNQYFITTHNPYFLLSLVEKAGVGEVSVFITYYENYQTKVKLLSTEDIEKLMGMGGDLFFNIDKFMGT
ncbi:MAG: AAA family ATPase [Candidatus Odinarchaeia archaeon]